LRGEKGDFNVYVWRNCDTLYTPGKKAEKFSDYDDYYDESNFAIPILSNRGLPKL